MFYLGLTDIKEIPLEYEGYLWASQNYIEAISESKRLKLNYIVLSDNWSTASEVNDSLLYLQDIERKLLNTLSEILNSYHEFSYSKRSWYILLNQWITEYLSSLYDKYLKLINIERQEISCECLLYDVSSLTIPLDYLEYHELAYTSDEYNLFQYSCIFNEMKEVLPHIHVKYIVMPDEITKPLNENNCLNWKYIAYQSIIDLVKRIIPSENKVVFQNSFLPAHFLLDVMKRNAGKIVNYKIDYKKNERTKFHFNIDNVWRQSSINFHDKDKFNSIAQNLLKLFLPKVYVEGLTYICNRVSEIYKYSQTPHAIFFASEGITYDEIFKVYLMTMREKNVTFCGIQHGGNYGIDINWLMKNEYESCDIFYTWGWKIKKKYSCEFRPMPASKLLNSNLQYVKKGEYILYVSYNYSKYLSRIESREIFYHINQEQEIEFLSSLNNDIKKQLRVRLYPRDYGWNIRDNIADNVPDIIFDDTKDFYEALNHANFVILMDWSTTVLEALYANKPILVLRSLEDIEPDAFDDLHDLYKVGILVQTWEELKNQIESILCDITGWWQNSERQAVVNKIKSKYIFMPEDAKNRWFREILNYCN